MSQYPNESFQPPMMSPPVYGGEIPVRQSSWPTVLGIIMIILASIGLLSNTCGGLANVAMPLIISNMPEDTDPMAKVQLDIAQRFMIFQIANSVIMIALGVVLLIAGIKLLKRRRRGVSSSRLWAVARILWAVPAAIATYYITVETLKMMEQASADSGQPMPAGAMPFMQMLGPISAVVGFFFACAMPTFVLIWFARQKIKAEVAAWP